MLEAPWGDDKGAYLTKGGAGAGQGEGLAVDRCVAARGRDDRM